MAVAKTVETAIAISNAVTVGRRGFQSADSYANRNGANLQRRGIYVAQRFYGAPGKN